MAKSPAKAARKLRHKPRKAASKPGKMRKKVAAESFRNPQRKTDARLEQLGSTNVQDTVRRLAEQNVAQTRELYERSKSTMQAILESWQKFSGLAGQGAVAVNRRIIDIADRNINNTFDLAADLAGAKSLAAVIELQAAYWRKQFVADISGELRSSPR